jgi:hypothetical protein
MSTTATHYTKLYPKQGNLTGSPDKAYNLLAAKTLTISLEVLVLAPSPPWELLPRVPTTFPKSMPPKFIPTSAETSWILLETHPIRLESSAVSTSTNSFGLFQIIDSKANLEEAMPVHSSTIIPFASDLLTNTDWANPSDNISGALFPNFFIVYFGEDFSQGAISSNNIKVKFTKLGAGYDLWVSAAAEAIDKRNDILELLGALSEQTNYSRTDFLKSHFFPSYHPAKSLPIASGPHGFISLVY